MRGSPWPWSSPRGRERGCGALDARSPGRCDPAPGRDLGKCAHSHRSPDSCLRRACLLPLSFFEKSLLRAKLEHRNFAQKLIGFPNTAMQLVQSGCNLSGKKSERPRSPSPPVCEACCRLCCCRPSGLGTRKNSGNLLAKAWLRQEEGETVELRARCSLRGGGHVRGLFLLLGLEVALGLIPGKCVLAVHLTDDTAGLRAPESVLKA